MATELINKLKTFNSQTIQAELDAIPGLPAVTTRFVGSENADLGRLQPFPEATRVVTRTRQSDGTVVDDVAARGDIRFESRNPLPAGQVTEINTVLDDHDESVDTTAQAKQRQQMADVSSLRVLFDAGISDPTLSLAVKVQLVELGEDI